MTKFVKKNLILTPSQFGFRENNSTDLAITKFYDKSQDNINDVKITCSIFLELNKAFDSVDMTISLNNFAIYGSGGRVSERNFSRGYEGQYQAP